MALGGSSIGNCAFPSSGIRLNGGCCAVEVKIAPSNQTLILAGDSATGKSAVSPRQSADPSANGAVLQRVTVVTALPDSTMVYVHADYAPASTAAAGRMVATQPKAATQSPVATTNAAAADAESADTDPSDASGHSGTLVQLSSPEYTSLLHSSDGSRDPSGNPQSPNQNVNLYAQTQLINAGGNKPTLVDVHA
jgi:hypothetical protein